ncbi:MAG TPA: DMT family transporter [Anaerolineae bacterium]
MLHSKFSRQFSPHVTAVLQALFVTFLWSTSWVLIKFGLADIPALTFAGLRYMLAFLCLLPIFYRSAGLHSLRGLSRWNWLQLVVLGILFYSLTQGAQFVGLAYLPAVTVNLMLGFTSIVVALLGIVLLAERPTGQQWLGVTLSLLGIFIYFYPVQLPAGQVVGFIAVIVGVLANATSAVLGRAVNRSGHLPPLAVTVVTMGIGATLLLAAGLAVQGLPALDWQSWLIILWLAVVNTAFAFTLWNVTLRTLSAMESSVINNTMSIQIPILAVIFLGERPTGREVLGLVLAALGILLVQLRRRRRVRAKATGILSEKA